MPEYFDEWVIRRAIIRLNATRYHNQDYFLYPRDRKNTNVRAMARMVKQYEKKDEFNA